MRIFTVIFLGLLLSTQANAWFFGSGVNSRYKEYCMLDLLSQANNDIAARAAFNSSECKKLPSVVRSEPNRFHERTYKSRSECIQKYGLNTPSEQATRGISNICNTLTSKANSKECRPILDYVISIQDNPHAWSRDSLRDWYRRNPSHQRPSGFNEHCL